MKKSKVEATVVLAKCCKTGKTYGNRVEKKSDGNWHFTWSFKIDDNRAKSEGYEKTSVKGNVFLDESYKGCPYCGASGWFSCGNCGKLTCNDGNKNVVTCKWCGNIGELSGDGDGKFNLTGGEM